MEENNSFKPYVSADKVLPEFTPSSIIIGVLLAIVFGAANAYLGLRVGMTVSASIPAAVIGMGVYKLIGRFSTKKDDTILESNMVQTIGSAGESLAAGAIFTMPALFLWAEEGLCDKPSLVEITLIALCGGVLGVLFMVPLRNALIVKEHATLLYPEGTACADVLLAGEEGGANASTVFSGMGLAAVFKFVVDGLKVIPADVSAAFTSLKGEIGMEVYPALLGVGYIVGPRVASFMFVGSIVGWLVIIPMICLFGPDTWLYPADPGVTISQLYAAGGASAIWSKYVKYIGAGAIATGGIISLIKSMPLIISTFRDSMKSMKGGSVKGTARTIAERSSEQARALKEIRKNGGVPCVLYGGNEVVHFTVPNEGLRNLVYTPHIYVVDLIIDGKKVNAILKDIQFHPVKDTILHVDFYQIDEAKPIVMEVPVQLEGLAEGVKAGGKLALQMRKIKVKALYNVIPEKLTVNVSHLGLGKTVKVGELSFEGLELMSAKEAVVCAVKLTRAARGAAAAAGK